MKPVSLAMVVVIASLVADAQCPGLPPPAPCAPSSNPCTPAGFLRPFISTIAFGSFVYLYTQAPPYFCPPNPPGFVMTGMNGVVSAGTVPITVGVIPTNSLVGQIRAFVDWDGDNTFTAVSGSPRNEFFNLTLSSTGPVYTFTGSVSVPLGAKPGARAFRVGLGFPGFPGPCGGDSFVDGTITVVGATGTLLGYQVNQPGAGLVLSGAIGSAIAPVVLAAPGGANMPLDLCSNLTGVHGFELFIAPASIVPYFAGGATSPSGQRFNLPVSNPGIVMLNGGTFTVPFTQQSFTVVVPAGVVLSAQMVVIDPSSPDGFSLSQPVEVHT